MARRCFTVNGSLEIRDEDNHVIHQETLRGHDVWTDDGVYKTYLECLNRAREALLPVAKEHEIRSLVCSICPTCKRTKKGGE